jgi:3-oxoacyl-[acyl-carrier-protein] synthase III
LSKYARITGTGLSVPEKTITNHDLEKIVDTNDEWIKSRTGMSVRHVVANGEATSDFAIPAARQALENSGCKPEDVDLVIVGTISPDMFFPSTACLVQDALGCKNAGAFDLMAACSGFTAIMTTAKAYIESGLARVVLAIGADTITHYVDWTDRDTCVLFGDGAGAVVLVADDTPGVLGIDIGSDGGKTELLKLTGGGSRTPMSKPDLDIKDCYVKMEGKSIFKLATRVMSQSISRTLEAEGLTADDVSLVIPHQANIRILTAVAERLKINMDRWMINIEKYGNTTAATIPIALHEALEAGRISKGDLIVMVAFGGGLTWGTVLVRW